jgi:hypothetical protein
MKLSNLSLDLKSVVLGTAVGTVIMLSVGAATSGSENKWEYKVVAHNANPNAFSSPEKQEALLDDFGKQGWIFVQNEGGWFYFKRAMR